MRKWRCIVHTVRKGKNPLKKKLRIEIFMKPEGKKERSNSRKRPIWRKKENAAKHGVRLRGWLATESEADASQIFFCF